MEPKYVELTRQLIKEFADGTYPVGALLPSEIELAEQYRVSRSTLRLAFARLQELKLISRRKKGGTRVERAHPQATGYVPHLSNLDELFEFHLNTKRTISHLREIVVDIGLSKVLQCDPGEHWIQCLVTRTMNDDSNTPLSYSDVYVYAELLKGKQRKLLKTDVLINEFIARESGVAAKKIKQTISATTVPAAVARFFDIAQGGLALEIKRQHYDEGNKIYHVGISILPADRFAYETEMTRSISAPS